MSLVLVGQVKNISIVMESSVNILNNIVAKLEKLNVRESFALLYSGRKAEFTGSKSYLYYDLDKRIVGGGFKEVRDLLKSLPKENSPANNLVGYFGYELKNEIEKLPVTNAYFMEFPKNYWAKFQQCIEFDHNRNFSHIDIAMKGIIPKVKYLKSNMTNKSYLEKVGQIQEKILDGIVYQTNLTRKFYGEFEVEPCPIKIFYELAQKSPAPYSCLMSLGDGQYIISSTMEQFLGLKDSIISARPIKGSAKRGITPEEDKKIIEEILLNEKNKAENLMILDLMRSDIAKSSKKGSIKVPELFKVSSYKTIHHLHSTATGQKLENLDVVDVIKNAFPPGSMTGAPKVSAMEIISDLEEVDRGVYSGALGYIGREEFELAVVIRTLLIDGKKFEFQVGGAITIDSNPLDEMEECFIKAKGILRALNIQEEALSNVS